MGVWQGDSSDLLKMRSDETGRLLQQHGTLMNQFQQNISTRRSLAGASRAMQRANEQQLSETAGSLGHATKSLTRSLQENVDLPGNMNKLHAIGHECHRLFGITVQELAEPDVGRTTLEETTEAEQRVRTTMADTIASEKELSVKVAKLRSELAAETLDMETEIGLKDLKLAGALRKLCVHVSRVCRAALPSCTCAGACARACERARVPRGRVCRGRV